MTSVYKKDEYLNIEYLKVYVTPHKGLGLSN